ncbi:hypothetical protein L2X98_26830 [Microbacterium elymi]|uniref:Uncharacterized protein n=1 Tax=Microbacterium elymi TaxID=2909587 RepID=A0ABY5NGF0_9MICO|nr:hypothetical protein [Microbacterium elymi]UUT34288.1 hypothetical protein L2X98_26830 [Microbacterium elymi]
MARAIVGEAEDLVADREPGDLRADLGHDAGEVAALALREVRGPAGVQIAASDRRLARVDAGRAHPHDHLMRSGRRIGDLPHVQNIHVAVPVESHCLHASANLTSLGVFHLGSERYIVDYR